MDDLTDPMRTVLVLLLEKERGGQVHNPYQVGQTRMILAGLARRGLVGNDRLLTEAGRDVAAELVDGGK